MAVLVTNSVLTTVRNQGVTYQMELVTVVHLDGREISVKKVRKKHRKRKQNKTIKKKPQTKTRNPWATSLT